MNDKWAKEEIDIIIEERLLSCRAYLREGDTDSAYRDLITAIWLVQQ
jgi:hypothetical protein